MKTTEDRSPFRAYVSVDYAARGVAIHLIEEHGNTVTHWLPDGQRETVDPAAASDMIAPIVKATRRSNRLTSADACARY